MSLLGGEGETSTYNTMNIYTCTHTSTTVKFNGVTDIQD